VDLAGAGVRIGIIDTGIDATHPAFVDPSIPMPEGFPRANRASDLAYTSNRVIVARSYRSLFSGLGDTSAADSDGHGTAVAMAAAGGVQPAGNTTISGAAPKAYLGNYNVFPPGDASTTRADVVLKALDDAVRDGMDVINLSLGAAYALRPDDDFFTRVAERLGALGVVVVVSAGNEGPEPFTIGDTSVAPAVIAVGATWNDRSIGASVRPASGPAFEAVAGDGPRPFSPVTAPLADVAVFDQTGLACGVLPPGSLAGRLTLIQRGTCFFEEKLNNAQAAGAVGAVVYTDDRPVVGMSVGAATLPGVMVSREDGLALKLLAVAASPPLVTVDYRVVKPEDPNRVASFSSRGPNTDLSIKPDLVAVGTALNTATLNDDYDTVDGTSFSAPIVAGAVAVLKAARPGLSAEHYRSLLINAASPVVLSTGEPVGVQQAGGGDLNLEASLETAITASPPSVSFGAGSGSIVRRLRIYNLGSDADTVSLSAEPIGSGLVPLISETGLALAPRGAATVNLTMAAAGAAAGEYQGFIRIRGSRPGSDIRVPYWLGVPSGSPARIKIVDQIDSGSAGSLQRYALAIRITDSAGVPVKDPAPTVTPVSGGGTVVSVFSSDELYPGLFEVNIRLGATPGQNVFRVEAGGLTKDVSIAGV
jgi:subtilisin family serine protease